MDFFGGRVEVDPAKQHRFKELIMGLFTGSDKSKDSKPAWQSVSGRVPPKTPSSPSRQGVQSKTDPAVAKPGWKRRGI